MPVRAVAGPANALHAVAASQHTNDRRYLWRQKRIEFASDPLIAVYPNRGVFRQDSREIHLSRTRMSRPHLAHQLPRSWVVPRRGRA
jgi:hypothetical protein